MNLKISKDLALHRIEQAKQDLAQASTIREDSDYDDEFVVDANKTLEQIETANQLINLVEEFFKGV